MRPQYEGFAEVAGPEQCEQGRCLLACRMENLFINRFMHMFQSSWSDFADFEKIFVKISNTISGECAFGVTCGAGETSLGTERAVPPHSGPVAGLTGWASLPQAPPFPGLHLHAQRFLLLGHSRPNTLTLISSSSLRNIRVLCLHESAICDTSEQSKGRM